MQLPPMNAGIDGRQIGVRVIRLGIWKDLLEIDWCRYLAARSQGVPGVEPPMMTNHNQRVVYFTDIPSVNSCFHAEDLAERLTLANVDRFREEGALVVYFPLSDIDCHVPVEDGIAAPLTAGGARQWIATRNIPFSEDAMITEVIPQDTESEDYGLDDSTYGDPPWHWTGSSTRIHFAESTWNYANPKLAEPSYWEKVTHNGAKSGTFVPRGREELEHFLNDLGG